MIYLILGLVALGVVAMIFGYIRDRRLRRMLEKGIIDKIPEAHEIETDCGSCMQECSMAQRTKPIVYFNDEELDAYKGIASDAYDDEATDAFREVLYTLRESEVGDWLCSLQQRNINLPDALKDEAIMLFNDSKAKQPAGAQAQQ